MKNENPKRFEIIFEEGSTFGTTGVFRIIKDCTTGVQYLFYKDGVASGFTPLMGKDGKIDVVLPNID